MNHFNFLSKLNVYITQH